MKKSLLNSNFITTTLVLFVMFFTNVIIAQTNTWDGSSNIRWDVAANWSLNHVPLATEDVVIPTGTPRQPTVRASTSAVCNNITINAGATLTFANNATSLLNISGNYTNNGTLNAGVSSKITFVGASSQTIAGSSASNFGFLTVNTPSALTTVTSSGKAFSAQRDVTVTNGNLILQATDSDYVITRDLIVGTNGKLTHNVNWSVTSKKMTVGRSVAVDGIYTSPVTSHLQMKATSNSPYIRSGANVASAFSMVSFANTSRTINANGNVVVNGSLNAGNGVTGGTFATAGQTITLNNGLIASGGNININGGTVNITAGGFNVGVTQSSTINFSSGTLTTNQLTIGNGAFVGTFNQTSGSSSTTNINGNITINPSGSYTILGSGTKNINIKGNWTNNGTYTRRLETVTFNGAVPQSINGATTFNKLVNANTASTLTFNAVTSVFNDLSIETGAKIDLNSFTTHSAKTLTLGGLNVASGTWGSTSSAATNKNNTYFTTPSTGIINVSNGTPTAVFSNLTASKVVCADLYDVTLSGKVSNGAGTNAVNGSTVDITIDGNTQVATIGTGGNFTFNYVIYGIPSSVTPYTITYSFAGDANLNAAVDNTSTTLTINSLPEVGTVSPSTQIVCGGSGGYLSSDITLSNATGTIRWIRANNPSFTSSTIISGATSTTLTIAQVGPITATTYIRAIVQNSCGTVSSSNFVTVTLGSAAVTWNGTSWSGIPTINKPAIINGNYAEAANLSACSLTVNSGTVVIPSGYNVTLNGALTVNSGSFTLESNANLIQNTSALNSGNIIVKRNSSALYRLDYTLWSSPVTGSQTLLNFSPDTYPTRFYEYVTATNEYAAVDPSINTFNLAKGYLIRMPNAWPAYPAGPATSWGGEFVGVPNNGNINFSMSLAGTGFNATGNPYPSTINMTTFINANVDNITGELWFWRKTNDASNLVSYATCTTGGCTNFNSGVGYPSPNFISPGQGFLVQATSSTLNFNNSMRVANNTNQFFKTAEKNRYWLELTNSEKVSFGQNLVIYLPEATLGFDNGIDGTPYKEMATTLLTQSGDKEVVIQARPEFNAQDVLPLIFKTDAAGSYTINLTETDGLFRNGQTVYLRDNLLNKTQSLNEGSYTFNTEAGNFTSRFDITYQTTLSVNPAIFNENSVIVYKQNQDLIINTGTTTMSNVKVYDIQGRLLINQKNINATQTKITKVATNQILLVKITSTENGSVTKKVMH